MTAEKDKTVELGIFNGARLAEDFASGGKKYDAAWGAVHGLNGFDSAKDRFAFEEHAGAAAVRLLIDGVMFVQSVVAQLVKDDAHEAAVLGAAQDAVLNRALHDFWK
jgi:hypothetical protein